MWIYENCPMDCEWPGSDWADQGARCPRHGDPVHINDPHVPPEHIVVWLILGTLLWGIIGLIIWLVV